MKNVSRQQIQSLVTPLPPLSEQKRIIKQVNNFLKLLEQLKIRISEEQKTKLIIADTITNVHLT